MFIIMNLLLYFQPKVFTFILFELTKTYVVIRFKYDHIFTHIMIYLLKYCKYSHFFHIDQKALFKNRFISKHDEHIF